MPAALEYETPIGPEMLVKDPVGEAIKDIVKEVKRSAGQFAARVSKTAECISAAKMRDAVIPGAFISHALKYDYARAVSEAAVNGNSSQLPKIDDCFNAPHFYSALAGYVAGLGGSFIFNKQTGRLAPALALIPAASVGASLGYAWWNEELWEFLAFDEDEPIDVAA